MAKAKSEPTLYDKIAEVYPRYRDLLVRQRELLDRRDQLHAELGYGSSQTFTFDRSGGREKVTTTGHISLADAAKRSGADSNLFPKPQPKPKTRHAGAVELVGELLSQQPAEEINPPPLPQSWGGEKRYLEISRELEAIKEALSLLGPEMTRARSEYARLVVEQRGDEYQSVAEAVVDAARALGDAILVHHNFINQQREGAVDWHYFRPIKMGSLADIDNEWCPLNTIIASAIQHGHVGAGKSPHWTVPANTQLLAN